MSNLLSIRDRLYRHPLSRIEKLQRESFITTIKQLKLSRAKALSVSCGDGIWDYMALSSNTGIIEITATDVVDCPVKENDIKLLRATGQWNFKKVIADATLPFESNSLDVAFSQDVIEHTTKPFKFLSEQYRVLMCGGAIIVGTPNILRPANLLRALLGKLDFPKIIGHNEEIGDYVHIQEFHEQQLRLMLEEVGFVDVTIIALYFGLSMQNISFIDYPLKGIGRTFAHFLLATGRKPN
jgi:ubiquinone/menaquinone biosynthesis C-methylase UbiE